MGNYRLSKITFHNYRIFYTEPGNAVDYVSIDTQKKNVLFYGENGSGKSSIFKGIKTLIKQSGEANPQISDGDINLIAQNQLGTGAFIEAEIRNTEDNSFIRTAKLDQSTGDYDDTVFAGASSFPSFLTYKELIRTHFHSKPDIHDDSDKFSKVLYELFVNNILGEHQIAGLSDAIGPFYKKARSLEKLIMRRSSNKTLKQEVHSQVAAFNSGLKDLLNNRIREKSNEILSQYFKHHHLKVEEFDITDLSFTEGGSGKKLTNDSGKLHLKVTVFGQEVDYRFVLNEARLSALALSVYLAALVTLARPELAVLFLDDIFIGLDTNNRIPLLQCLTSYDTTFREIEVVDTSTGETRVSERREQPFDDFQIFITTYDKHFFELAKTYLNSGDWVFMELYNDTVLNSGVAVRDKPIIIAPSLPLLERARKYFEAKDYPAAANYLRRCAEERLEKLVPIVERYSTGNKIKPKQLHHVGRKFEDNCKSWGVELPNPAFEVLKSTLLNPLSHHNRGIPIYRGELESCFEYIEFLDTLELGVLLRDRTPALLYLRHENKEYKLKLEEPFFTFKQIKNRVHAQFYKDVKATIIEEKTSPSTNFTNYTGNVAASSSLSSIIKEIKGDGFPNGTSAEVNACIKEYYTYTNSGSKVQVGNIPVQAEPNPFGY